MTTPSLLDQIYAASELRGPRKVESLGYKSSRNKIVRPKRQIVSSNRLYSQGLMLAEKRMVSHHERISQEADEQEEVLKNFSFQPQTNYNSGSKDRHKDVRAKLGTHLLLYNSAIEPVRPANSEKSWQHQERSLANSSGKKDKNAQGWGAVLKGSDLNNTKLRTGPTMSKSPGQTSKEMNKLSMESYKNQNLDHSRHPILEKENKPQLSHGQNLRGGSYQKFVPEVQHHQIDLSEDEVSNLVMGSYIKPKRYDLRIGSEPKPHESAHSRSFSKPVKVNTKSFQHQDSIDGYQPEMMSEDLEFLDYRPEEELHRGLDVYPIQLDRPTRDDISQTPSEDSMIGMGGNRKPSVLRNDHSGLTMNTGLQKEYLYQPNRSIAQSDAWEKQTGQYDRHGENGAHLLRKPFFEEVHSDRLYQLPTEYASSRSATLAISLKSHNASNSEASYHLKARKKQTSPITDHEPLRDDQILNKVKEFENAFRSRRPHGSSSNGASKIASFDPRKPSQTSGSGVGKHWKNSSLNYHNSSNSWGLPKTYSLNLSVDESDSQTKRTSDLSLLSSVGRNLRNTKTREMFDQLDSDGDGFISASNISITEIPLPKLKIISPILLRLEKDIKALSFEEFEDLVMNLSRSLTQLDKQTLFYASGVQGRPSVGNSTKAPASKPQSSNGATLISPTAAHTSTSRLRHRESLSFSFNLDRDMRRKSKVNGPRKTLVQKGPSNLDYHTEFRERHLSTQSGQVLQSSRASKLAGQRSLFKQPAREDLAFTFGHTSGKAHEDEPRAFFPSKGH